MGWTAVWVGSRTGIRKGAADPPEEGRKAPSGPGPVSRKAQAANKRGELGTEIAAVGRREALKNKLDRAFRRSTPLDELFEPAW